MQQGVPLVEEVRGGLVESLHQGALVVADGRGDVVTALGNADLLTFPRSAMKPFQLLALVQRGGVERFNFSESEVAVMAASHSGEERHVESVCSILRKIGAPESALACGPHAPLGAAAASELQASGQAPRAVHNNCSGKHVGMLALARLLEAPLEGYVDVRHPAQRAVREGITAVLGIDERELVVGVDGCSAPAYAVTLRVAARGFARLARPTAAPSAWQEPLRRVAAAMRAHPDMVGGTSDRLDTDLMRLGRELVAKSGAEGFFAVAHPEGLGLTLKVLDGDPTRRARHVAMTAALSRLGWMATGDLPAYGPVLPLPNWAGLAAAELRPSATLQAFHA